MRRREGHFARDPGAPPDLTCCTTHRVRFGEVDAMGVMWHGHYAALFEEASTELRGICGLGYEDFLRAGIAAPVAQLHVEYRRPLLLDDVATVRATMVWSEAARLNVEYEVRNARNETTTTGYSVQLFSDVATGAPCFCLPPLLEESRRRWKAGELDAFFAQDRS